MTPNSLVPTVPTVPMTSVTYVHLAADPADPPTVRERETLGEWVRSPQLHLPCGFAIETYDLHDGTAAAAEWWHRMADAANEIAAWHHRRYAELEQQAAERATADDVEATPGGAR